MTTSGNTGTLGGVGGGGTLVSVNVNTGAASAVLTLKVKDTNGATIAVIDASAKGSYQYGCNIQNGVFASLAGGNADVTICFG
jgi:hypothetical protein